MTQITRMAIHDILMVEPKKFGDERGYFVESYNAAALVTFGFSTPFIRDNQSMSSRRGTVRGLHFQAPPRAQDRLIRVLRGPSSMWPLISGEVHPPSATASVSS